MRISGLIEKLKELRKRNGDLEIRVFQHEGGNSLRGYPEEVDDDTFEVKNSNGNPILYIGGWYR